MQSHNSWYILNHLGNLSNKMELARCQSHFQFGFQQNKVLLSYCFVVAHWFPKFTLGRDLLSSPAGDLTQVEVVHASGSAEHGSFNSTLSRFICLGADGLVIFREQGRWTSQQPWCQHNSQFCVYVGVCVCGAAQLELQVPSRPPHPPTPWIKNSHFIRRDL